MNSHSIASYIFLLFIISFLIKIIIHQEFMVSTIRGMIEKVDAGGSRMKLLTFVDDISQTYRTGVLTSKGVLDISDDFSSIEDVMSNLAKLEALIDFYVEGEGVEFLIYEDLTLGPVIPNRKKIICVGLNYKRHAEEMKVDKPDRPILFTKFNNALTAYQSTIKIPKGTEMIDYEGELAIIICKRAKNVSREEAMDYVFGYSNANDVSEREFQFQTIQ